MPILPLPQFEADLAEQDREIYERLKPPSSIVARFGIMKMVGEFPYSGEAKPGCGSKLVIKTHRGTELGEMLTSTCPNSGCSKSVSRQEMLQYIENSGGRDYPFFSMQGRVLRIATPEDLNEQARIDSARPQLTRSTRAMGERMGLAMKVVDSEPILGGEKLTFYFTSEDRIDFRELVEELAKIHGTRIEMRQVGARDEARLVADYERCGQHCCCKQFLKVLKPISMKSAKIQKATLDPLKISGRCGRLMCCLRYEDETYDQLRARLPKKKTRAKTPDDGWGLVIDTQILTQLVLVQLDSTYEQVAIPVEQLEMAGPDNPAPPVPPHPSMREGPPPSGPTPGHPPRRDDRRGPPPRPPGGATGAGAPAGGRTSAPPTDRRDRSDRRAPNQPTTTAPPSPTPARSPAPPPAPRPAPADLDDEVIDLDDIETDTGDDRAPRRGPSTGGGGGGSPRDQRPPRDRGRGGGGGGGGGGPGGSGSAPPSPSAEGPQGEGRRRRRRRRRGGGGPGGGGGGGPPGGGGGDSPPPG